MKINSLDRFRKKNQENIKEHMGTCSGFPESCILHWWQLQRCGTVMRKHPSFIALPEVILSIYKKLVNYGNVNISGKIQVKSRWQIWIQTQNHISVFLIYSYILYIFSIHFLQYIVHSVYLYVNCHFSTNFIFLHNWAESLLIDIFWGVLGWLMSFSCCFGLLEHSTSWVQLYLY